MTAGSRADGAQPRTSWTFLTNHAHEVDELLALFGVVPDRETGSA